MQDQDQMYKTKTKIEAGLRPVLSQDHGLRPQDWALPVLGPRGAVGRHTTVPINYEAFAPHY